MIGVVDYGAGNLRSVANALDRCGLAHRVCASPADLARVERLILPGVGHFAAAARELDRSGMRAALRAATEAGTPLLGICLGLQLLFESSDEAPGVAGLALIPGRCVRVEAKTVPHIGWNRVTWTSAPPPIERAAEDGHYYFAHGYAVSAKRAEDVVARVELDGLELPAAAGRSTLVGVQFHPEKSGDRGLALLEAFGSC